MWRYVFCWTIENENIKTKVMWWHSLWWQHWRTPSISSLLSQKKSLKLQNWQSINTFYRIVSIILIYSLPLRLMMIFSPWTSTKSHLNVKSSRADNCHILFFLPGVLILNIILPYPDGFLISLHHIDEYKLLLTLSDVDSFTFYVFSLLANGGVSIACCKSS